MKQHATFTSGNSGGKNYLDSHTASPSLLCCSACGHDGFWWCSQTGSWAQPCPDTLHCNVRVCSCVYERLHIFTSVFSCYVRAWGSGQTSRDQSHVWQMGSWPPSVCPDRSINTVWLTSWCIHTPLLPFLKAHTYKYIHPGINMLIWIFMRLHFLRVHSEAVRRSGRSDASDSR